MLLIPRPRLCPFKPIQIYYKFNSKSNHINLTRKTTNRHLRHPIYKIPLTKKNK